MKRLAAFLLIALFATLASAQNSLRVYPESQKGFASYVRGAPSYVNAQVLAANVNETISVPTGANAVIFSSNCTAFYVKIGTTAAVPAADVTDGSGSELNPASWFVGASTQIGIISPTACVVTHAWYSLAP